MPTARWELSTSVVNGFIYAIGGGSGRGQNIAFSAVEAYDPAMDTWAKKSDMPTGRVHFSTSVVNGKIYAIGGWGGWAEKAHLSTVEGLSGRWCGYSSEKIMRFAGLSAGLR